MSKQGQREIRCERCEEAFGCGAKADHCWCSEETFRMPLPKPGSRYADCLCPACLREVAREAKAAGA